MVQEIDEGRPCLACEDRCTGFTAHEWRYSSLQKSCLMPQMKYILSHNVVSGNEIPPCNKIDKPLVVYRFVRKVKPSMITLRKRGQNLEVFTPKM